MAETRLIQSRYRLLDLIGRGGMGEVWRARDEALGRQVAVKCLKPMSGRHDKDHTRVVRERFRREARVAAALQHRGVTVVHDFGEYEGVLYLVMELLDGRNLSQLLEDNEQNPLPVDDIVDIAEQVADALGYTHQQGIVHRDLKPANIMRLSDGTVKICDFGIARPGHGIPVTSRLTGVGVAMGTPHYMSPEQISGGQVDHRSDLYSLGCVLYEIATGAPPFDMEDSWGILVGHRDTTPEPPRSHRAELPGFFDRVVLDLLAKTPEERPADAHDLRRRIAVGRTGEQPFAEPAGRLPLAPPAPVTQGSRTTPGLPAWAATMTGGHKATVTGHPPLAPPDRTAGLTLTWTTGAAPHPAPPGTLAGSPAPGSASGRKERAENALREFGRLAEDRARLLGPDHGETLIARQQMAYALGRLGRHAEAHELHSAVLASRERASGPDHPDTLRCRHNLAFSLSRLGRLEDSYRMAHDVAGARARVLGPDHPDTLVTLYEVGYALGRLGRWTEALTTYRQVAEARTRLLGADHPDTLATRYEVGISLGRLGRSVDALELYRTLVADRLRVNGPHDPETLRARHGLGVNLGRLARWDEALAEARAVCAAREHVLGPDHPDTLVSRREVAVALGWLGRWAQALTVYRQVADARTRLLGAAHPDTLAGRDDEAHCLEQLGRAREAADLYRDVAALRQQPVGPPL
ncbi:MULTISPECIES: serine/threonine-protein kinase [unclassified Streptomyces]|uniref:serine/threonine-protein kinase n=1 Tax=unclassified Streptomyces TaxID=2593676 RepID=UPI000DAF1C34|nr:MULTISPECIES: serine/threonine-protein kinase [unclassified Streptomyces]PZT73479.1 serine/threonine protein kinase [Streptomyces sp. AC1-42T]PZT83528.1 serine/threonine protein kinase [Streptomyces sp. AC1-42W]